MCSSTPRNRFLLARLCGFPLFAATISAPAAVQCYYTWEQIPNPPGWVCQGGRINAHCHVAGNLLNLGENTRGYTWSPETGTRVLPFPNGAYDMTVTDMNDAGLVTGWATSTAQGWFGFVWDGSSYTIIPRPEWATQIRPAAINNAGQVVGTVMNTGFGPLHPFIWENGVLVDLSSLIDTPEAFGSSINELGVIVGYETGLERRGFLIEEGVARWLPPLPGGLSVYSAGPLNNNGILLGDARVSDPTFRRLAITWTPWSTEVMEPPPGARVAFLAGINDAGRATGGFTEGASVALVRQNQQITELRPLLVPPLTTKGSFSVASINSAGNIVGRISSATLILNPVWTPGDLTGDCHVGLEDLILVLSNFGLTAGTFPRGDADLDGDVDLSDLSVLLSHWGE